MGFRGAGTMVFRMCLLSLVVVAAGCARNAGGPATSSTTGVPSLGPSSTTVPPTAPTSTIVPRVTASGAFLTPPTQPTIKAVIATTTGCNYLVDDGYSGYCQTLTSPPGTVAYITETAKGEGSQEKRLLVYRRQGDTFSLALRWSGQVDLNRDRSPSLQAVDLAQDGDTKIVAVMYEPGAGSATATIRAVDVVEATGDVVVHLGLDHGLARQATGGGLESWSRLTGSDPLQFRHQVIRYKSGAWQAETTEDVAADAVPRSRDGSWF